MSITTQRDPDPPIAVMWKQVDGKTLKVGDTVVCVAHPDGSWEMRFERLNFFQRILFKLRVRISGAKFP